MGSGEIDDEPGRARTGRRVSRDPGRFETGHRDPPFARSDCAMASDDDSFQTATDTRGTGSESSRILSRLECWPAVTGNGNWRLPTIPGR